MHLFSASSTETWEKLQFMPTKHPSLGKILKHLNILRVGGGFLCARISVAPEADRARRAGAVRWALELGLAAVMGPAGIHGQAAPSTSSLLEETF